MIRPDLTDPTNWTFRNVQERTSAEVGQRLLPIETIVHVPLFFSPTLLIESSCNHAFSNWTFAGQILMRLGIGFGVGQDEYVWAESRGLRLGTNLIRFPDLGNESYGIAFSVPRWFNHVKYEFWEYIGDGSPNIEGKLDRIYDEL